VAIQKWGCDPCEMRQVRGANMGIGNQGKWEGTRKAKGKQDAWPCVHLPMLGRVCHGAAHAASLANFAKVEIDQGLAYLLYVNSV
jgi:hypothetical protein